MLPYMKRIADFLNGRGVRHILLDTGGDCNPVSHCSWKQA